MTALAARDAFQRACALDVLVQKPGNVSRASPGHGMQAEQFLVSATAAAGPIFAADASVGERIEGAVAATRTAVGCNTNLGIVLLCAPIARAVERLPLPAPPAALRQRIRAVLGALTLADARAAYRAIALAQPGGLGRAPSQDVNEEPTVDLGRAMALAADRDRIARQYRDGYGELFELPPTVLPRGFSLGAGAFDRLPDAATVDAVQRLYLLLLASQPDSHIVRKHGLGVAQNVMAAAQALRAGGASASRFDTGSGYEGWDLELKANGVNPGTTADLTVAALLLAGLSRPTSGPSGGARGVARR